MKAEEKAEILKSIEETAEDLGLKFGVIVLNKMNTTGIGDSIEFFLKIKSLLHQCFQ